MPTRTEVYAIIDGERNYQDWVWRQRCAKAGVTHVPDDKKPIEDWLIYLRGYYNDAVQEASHNPDGRPLDSIRKLAGLCVACIEANGGWERRNDGTFHPFLKPCLPRVMVYQIIDLEREYRGSRPQSINGALVAIDYQLKDAFRYWFEYLGQNHVLQEIVKLASTCVHCMEEHGAPRRVIDEKVASFKAKRKLLDLINRRRDG